MNKWMMNDGMIKRTTESEEPKRTGPLFFFLGDCLFVSLLLRYRLHYHNSTTDYARTHTHTPAHTYTATKVPPNQSFPAAEGGLGSLGRSARLPHSAHEPS